MSDKTIVLVGKMSSGKTTIKKRLEVLAGFDSILEYTNRPIRPGECNGSDNIFVSKEEMLQKIKNKEFVCHQKYNTKEGDWYYGFLLKDFKPKSILLTNPDSLKQLLKNEFIDLKNLFIVYIDVDETSRFIKALLRGDDLDETYRRIVSEREQFKDIDSIVDFTINNHEYRDNPDDVYNEILHRYLSK